MLATALGPWYIAGYASKNRLNLIISTAIFFAASLAAFLIVCWIILHDAGFVPLLACSSLYVLIFRAWRDTRVAAKEFRITLPGSPWFAKCQLLTSHFTSADPRTAKRPPCKAP